MGEAVAEVDPFYDAEEERRALEQGERNKNMRESMKRKRQLEDVDSAVDRKSLPSAEEEFLAIPSEVVSEAPWRRARLRRAGETVNGFVTLHEELLEFAEWVSHSEDERRRKEAFLGRVQQVVSAVVDDARGGSDCVVFGSWYTGLSLPDSDLDVSIVLAKGRTLSEAGVVQKLRQLADRLLGEEVVEYVEIREKARIPLLVVRQGDCEMDMTFSCSAAGNVHPLGTSEFILHRGLKRYPHMRPLVLFLKVFLQQRALQDTFTGGVGSYLLSCMVIAFLQHKESRNLAGATLGHLLFDFFTFYTKDLNTSREGLSVIGAGARFSKHERRFENANAGGGGGGGGGDLLCVESPLEPHVDIGSKCFQWRGVKQAFMQARLVIANKLTTAVASGALPAEGHAPVQPQSSILVDGLIDPALFEGKLVDRPAPPPRPFSVHFAPRQEQHRGGNAASDGAAKRRKFRD